MLLDWKSHNELEHMEPSFYFSSHSSSTQNYLLKVGLLFDLGNFNFFFFEQIHICDINIFI